MEIRLEKAGKRYNREWIFQNWSHHFTSGKSYVILGGNGSGKSTALKCLLGFANLSSGNISYRNGDSEVSADQAYRLFTICAPYSDVYEELSLLELLRFHFSLREPLNDMSIHEIPTKMGLEHAKKKPVKYYSSGMKQRVKLGLAFFTKAQATLLDEPISNLDKKAIDWYTDNVESIKNDRLIIVASNQQKEEYHFCDQKIEIENLKQL